MVNYNMLRSVLTIKGQLQHVFDQFWQLKANYNMLWSVLIICGQLQQAMISSYN
jgi:hypothetical protein